MLLTCASVRMLSWKTASPSRGSDRRCGAGGLHFQSLSVRMRQLHGARAAPPPPPLSTAITTTTSGVIGVHLWNERGLNEV
eukprot:CAMPEP_0177683222 /NCGR_PEP_ID=MMETSP0447-20121125/31672_1 /TAXON_ID=0 /ORGANISM="Stygamoeba regulata, Strain BSH-02190019" /LENGTH=80 /DNA_ID=CAMNT_0019192767 /DNA_START=199 /DNA_END=441 /DNA_ORIENTATION=+